MPRPRPASTRTSFTAKANEAGRLHRDSTVIDMVCPLLVREQYIDEWLEGGATCVGPTVASDHTLVQTMDQIAT